MLCRDHYPQPMNNLTFLSTQSSKTLNHVLKIQYMLKFPVKSSSWHSGSQRNHPAVNSRTAEADSLRKDHCFYQEQHRAASVHNWRTAQHPTRMTGNTQYKNW